MLRKCERKISLAQYYLERESDKDCLHQRWINQKYQETLITYLISD